MKILLFLMLGSSSLLALPAVAHLSSGRAQQAHSLQLRAASTSSSMAGTAGTVVDLRSNGSGRIAVIRKKAGGLRTVALAGTLLSRDSQKLASNELRIGDQLKVLSGGRIKDMSQHLALIHGVVSTAPESQTGPMVVVAGAQGVIADPSAKTHYADVTHQTTGVAQISDSDLVTLRGVVDDVVDEMTQVRTISRLGPARHR